MSICVLLAQVRLVDLAKSALARQMAKLENRVFIQELVPFISEFFSAPFELEHEQVDVGFLFVQFTLDSLLEFCEFSRDLLFQLFAWVLGFGLAFGYNAIHAVVLVLGEFFDYFGGVASLLDLFVAEVLALLFHLCVPGSELFHVFFEVVVELFLELELFAEQMLHVRVWVEYPLEEICARNKKNGDGLGLCLQAVISPFIFQYEIFDTCNLVSLQNSDRILLCILPPQHVYQTQLL